MASTMKPVEQWTVVELREELKARGLTSSGLKGELYERLKGCVDSEPSGAATSNPPARRGRRPSRRASGASTGPAEQGKGGRKGRNREAEGGSVENGAGVAEEEEEEEEEVEEVERSGADIAVGARREEEGGDGEGQLEQEREEEFVDVEEEEEEEEGSEEDEEGDLVFKKVGGVKEEEEDEEDVMVEEEEEEEPDLVGEEEGDDLLANDDLDAMDTTTTTTTMMVEKGSAGHAAELEAGAGAGGQVDGNQAGKGEAGKPGSGAGGTQTAKTPEWQEFEIPKMWLPLPLIRVKDITEDSDLEALKEVLTQACNEMEIHSVHIDTSQDGAPPSALVRLMPVTIPWSLDPQGTSLDVVKTEECAANLTPLTKEHDAGEPVQGSEKAQEDSKPKSDQAGEADEPKSIAEAAGDVGDVKKLAEFCIKKLQAANVKLGESILDFEAPVLRTTLFVHNLREEYGNDDKKFSTDLSQHGELVRCFCVRNKDGKSKDYGFVEYALPRDAAQAKNVVDNKSSEALQRFRDAKMNAMQGDHGNILPEKRLRCEWSFNQTVPSIFSKICYISNLPVGFMDREALRAVFEPFGEIISCNIRSRAGMGPGCGFVEFAHGRDAETAMLEMNGTQPPNLGYILVSLVNPAKFPGDTAGAAFQRMGVFAKRPRPDFMSNRGRGFNRPFGMDPRSRGMMRGRGRGRGGPMQPQYAYGQYQHLGGYQQHGYQSSYYGGGYPYGQGSGYSSQYYPHHGHYRSGSSSPHHGGYKSSQYSGHGSWGHGEGGKGGGGYGYAGDHGYGQQSGYSQGYSGGNSYQSGSYSGYGSQGYGGSGYGGSHQGHSHGHYSGGNSSYQSGYGQYHGGYQSQQGYGGQGYGSQDYGSGFGQSGFDHGYDAHAGDKRVSDYGGDYGGQLGGQDSKRPRY